MKRISLAVISVVLALAMCSLSACTFAEDLFGAVLDGVLELTRGEAKKLTCITEKTVMAFSTDENHAVFVQNGISDDEKETVLCLVDIENDEIVNERSFRSTDHIKVMADHASSGYIFLDDEDVGKVCRVTSDLESVVELENVLSGGFGAAGGDCYVYCERGELVLYSIGDGSKTYIQTQFPLHVVSTDGYCSLTEEIVLSVCVGFDSYVEGKAVVNLSDGAVTLLTADYEEITPFGESLMTVGNLGGDPSYIWIDKADAAVSYGVNIAKLDGGKTVASAPMLYMVSGGELLLLDIDEDGISPFSLYKSDDNYTTFYVSYLECSDSYAFCVNNGDLSETFVCSEPSYALNAWSGDDYFRVENVELMSDYYTDMIESDLAKPEVSEQYMPLREYADEIEGKYDVDILIADQCVLSENALPDTTDFDLSSACYETEEEEISAIRSYLEVIDRALGEFPSGFFAQFRTASGDAGVRMLLTGSINTSDRDFASAGVSWSTFKWYYSAFDISETDDMHDTVCHELFHCIDNRLKWYDSTWNEGWSGLNPEYFEYQGDYSDYLKETEYNYEYPNYDWYFIDTYCYVNIEEDMARVFEYATSEFPDYASDFFGSDHIVEKLRFLDRKIREVFFVDESNAPAFWTYFL